MTPEEAQALMNVGASIDAAGAQEQAEACAIEPVGGVLAAGPESGAMDWIFLPELISMVVTTALPETEPFYTDAANMKMAEKLAAVAAKRGWSGMSSSPEIGLGIAAIGCAMPAVMAYKARQAAKAEEAAKGATLNGRPVVNGGTDGD